MPPGLWALKTYWAFFHFNDVYCAFRGFGKIHIAKASTKVCDVSVLLLVKYFILLFITVHWNPWKHYACQVARMYVNHMTNFITKILKRLFARRKYNFVCILYLLGNSKPIFHRDNVFENVFVFSLFLPSAFISFCHAKIFFVNMREIINEHTFCKITIITR